MVHKKPLAQCMILILSVSGPLWVIVCLSFNGHFPSVFRCGCQWLTFIYHHYVFLIQCLCTVFNCTNFYWFCNILFNRLKNYLWHSPVSVTHEKPLPRPPSQYNISYLSNLFVIFAYIYISYYSILSWSKVLDIREFWWKVSHCTKSVPLILRTIWMWVRKFNVSPSEQTQRNWFPNQQAYITILRSVGRNESL